MVNDTLFLWANAKRLEWAAQGLWVSIERRCSWVPSLETFNDAVMIIISYQDTCWIEITMHDSGALSISINEMKEPSSQPVCLVAESYAAVEQDDSVQKAEMFVEQFIKLIRGVNSL